MVEVKKIFCVKCKSPMTGHNRIERAGVLYDRHSCQFCGASVVVECKDVTP